MKKIGKYFAIGCVVAIIGMLGAGVAGEVIKGFAIFLVGVAYFPLILSILVLGLFLIIKRKAPKWVSRLLIGICLILKPVQL